MRRIQLKNPHKFKNAVFITVVTTIYLVAFMLLERRQVPIHVIHCAVDQMIPFCEYFIIPYLLWFFYVLVTGAYFAFVNEDNKEFFSFFHTLIVGMVVFIAISWFYPNGQLLRPQITGDNIFKQLVLMLYGTDTSTNILPSLHVYYSLACCIAFERHEKAKKKPWLMALIRILTVSIILSTMFLKQHSIIDVVMAIAINGICYHLFYHIIDLKSWKRNRDAYRRRKKKIEGILR